MSFSLILDELLFDSDSWPFDIRSRELYQGIVTDRFLRLRIQWLKGRPQILPNGNLEEPNDVEVRVILTKEVKDQMARHYTRRRTVSQIKKSSIDSPDICGRNITPAFSL